MAYASKELSRAMASPSEADLVKLKRALRYLRAHPRGIYQYKWQDEVNALKAQVDSDWAGCQKTRRSTSGGIIFRGAHALSHWSRTQTTVALSSGEAELNASLKGACELVGMRELLREIGQTSRSRWRAIPAPVRAPCTAPAAAR